MTHVLVAGCGDVGTALATFLCRQSHRVWGLRRGSTLPSPINTINADLTDRDSLKNIAGDFDTIFYCTAADAHTPQAYENAYVIGLRNLLDHIKGCVKHVVFISSTAVYGQQQGEWVDEESVCKPRDFSGECLLRAEKSLSSIPHTIVRSAGIYGPGRTSLLEKIRSQQRLTQNPHAFTNRIHRDDLVRALVHLSELPPANEVYCASDGHPATNQDVAQWIANELGCTVNFADHTNEARGNKRVANHKLISSGFRFTYEDFRAGYRTLL